MKKIRNITLLLLLVVVNFSCDFGETKYETVKYNSEFQLDIPDNMVEVDLENPYAQIQYGDLLTSHFALVVMEKQSDLEAAGLEFTIDDYMDFALENILNSISNSENERVDEKIQNETGIDFISYKVWGTFDEENIDVYYRLTIYKSDSKFYNLMTWCLAEDERTYEPIMDKMVKSFKEL